MAELKSWIVWSLPYRGEKMSCKLTIGTSGFSFLWFFVVFRTKIFSYHGTNHWRVAIGQHWILFLAKKTYVHVWSSCFQLNLLSLTECKVFLYMVRWKSSILFYSHHTSYTLLLKEHKNVILLWFRNCFMYSDQPVWNS